MRPVEDLFLRYRESGDPRLLGQVFDRTGPGLLSLALHLCGNPSDAEDALQATFVTAIEKAGQYERGRPLLPWLSGILTLHCRKLRERRARRRERELSGEVPQAEADAGRPPLARAEQRELVERLRRQVDGLPPEQRQVLLLQLQHGLTPAEIGEVLGIAPGTVRARLFRGLEKLRRLLPAGLCTWLFGSLSSRGIAEVRRAVVARAGKEAVVALGGVLLMKRLLSLTVLLLVSLLVYATWPVTPAMSDAATPAVDPAVVATVDRPEEVAITHEGDETVRTAVPAAQRLPSDATLKVRVVREGTGEGVSGVTVLVLPQAVERHLGEIQGRTDATGVATFEGLPSGAVRVDLDRRWGGAAKLPAGETTEHTVELDEDWRVRGQVVDPQGAPVPFARLWFRWISHFSGYEAGTADRYGRFALRDLPERCYLGATHPDFAPSWVAFLRGQEEEVELTLQLPSLGASVSGTVVDPDGTPIAGARVRIGAFQPHRYDKESGQSWRSQFAQRLRTGTDGRFVATGLASGEILLEVLASRLPRYRQLVATRPGRSTAVDVKLRPSATVRGVVRTSAGEPVAGASVRCKGLVAEDTVSTRTAEDGAFVLPAVNPSAVNLRVSAGRPFRNYYTERVVEPGSVLEMEITLQTGERPAWRGVLRDEGGGPLAQWSVRGTHLPSRTSDAEGRFTLPLFRPSDTLWLAPSDTQAWFPCSWLEELPTDREFEVVVPRRFVPDGRVRARVLEADGRLWSGRAYLTPGRLRSISERCEVREGELVSGPLASGTCRLSLHDAGGWMVAPPRWLEVPHQGVLDLGEIRLPAMGRLRARWTLRDGATIVDPRLSLQTAAGSVVHRALDADGAEVPAGEYRYELTAENARKTCGSVVVEPEGTTELEIAAEPGRRRTQVIPEPVPDGWEELGTAEYVLLDPSGAEYEKGELYPGSLSPCTASLWPGTWTVEVTGDDGSRFEGSFEVEDLSPRFDPILVSVRPSR